MDMTARCERAEALLEEARAEADPNATGDRGESELRRLRGELKLLQANLAERDVELAYARETLASRRLPTFEPPDAEQGAAGGQEQQSSATPPWRTIRDVVLVALVAGGLFLAFPYILSFMPPSVRSSTAGLTSQIDALLGNRPAPAQTTTVEPPPAATRPAAVVVHAANVRSAPSGSAPAIAVLPRGSRVEVAGRRGNWTLVHVAAKPGQGWVYSPYLKVAPDTGK
jgi:hypothetical protein